MNVSEAREVVRQWETASRFWREGGDALVVADSADRLDLLSIWIDEALEIVEYEDHLDLQAFRWWQGLNYALVDAQNEQIARDEFDNSVFVSRAKVWSKRFDRQDAKDRKIRRNRINEVLTEIRVALVVGGILAVGVTPLVLTIVRNF